MRPNRRAALAVITAALLAVTVGCSHVTETVARLTDAKAPVGESSVLPVDPPNASITRDAAVADAAHSVVKIHSTAPGCQKILEGSGFVIAPDRVMSNAHVVAGANTFRVTVDGQERDATVVLFDPTLDISVLAVPGLSTPPLPFAEEPAPTGADAVVMGYPGGGEFTAEPARVREVIELSGPDIYRTTSIKREVYMIRGRIGQGDSGGPLIDLQGRVLGINFGSAVDDHDTGFVLTAKQVYSQMVIGAGATQPVVTGDCVK